MPLILEEISHVPRLARNVHFALVNNRMAHTQIRETMLRRSRPPILILTLMLACSAQAAAQTSVSRGYVRGTAGFTKLYLDEPSQFIGGGSFRVNFLKRFGAEPEFMATRGSRFSQWAVTPNLVVDLTDPERRATVYAIGGIGYVQELDKPIRYTRRSPAWSGGLGVRVFVGNRVFLAPEFRVGTMSRAVVSLGCTF